MKIYPKSKRSRILHRLRQCWSHISSSYRYVHLDSGQWAVGREREKEGGKEGAERVGKNRRAVAAAGACYRSQVHASGQLRLKFAGHSTL